VPLEVTCRRIGKRLLAILIAKVARLDGGALAFMFLSNSHPPVKVIAGFDGIGLARD
jgi:hypothetical protein